MKFVNDTEVDVIGTSLVGEIITTRAKIEEVFGKPTFDEVSFDEKSYTQWFLEFEDGTVATIYDWKRYEEGKVGRHELYDWHIGGKTAQAWYLVSEMLGA